MARLCGEDRMARAYDDDLRRKIFEAHAKGHGSFRTLAAVFGVSLGYVEKIFRQRKQTGLVERVRHRPGRKPRVGDEAQKRVVQWVEATPDLTLAEIQSKLLNEAQVQLSRGRVWYLLRKLGLRLKKSRSTPRSGTPKPTKSGARSSLKKSARPRRNA